MKSVSEQACSKTWTGEIVLKDGRLPDLKAWRDRLRESVGQAFLIRGVEVTVEGRLVEKDGRLALEVGGGQEALCLAPLRDKVQWDPEKKRPQAPTEEERQAYQKLAAAWKESPGRVCLVGPLAESKGGAPPVLEVRTFARRR